MKSGKGSRTMSEVERLGTQAVYRLGVLLQTRGLRPTDSGCFPFVVLHREAAGVPDGSFQAVAPVED